MAVVKILIDPFLELGKNYPVLDVRSPAEFDHAHIPGAHNLPLFTDEERKVVGTTYKLQSREAAIKTGLDYFGPRMRKMVEQVENITASASEGTDRKRILVHCWRGGMRSEAVAWLLDLYGYKVSTLAGGYKSYRKRVLETFALPFAFNILGGNTGSGKTYVLEEMKKMGIAVINLEELACHKGSAFGNIGMPAQPSQEMFENLLCGELRSYMSRIPDLNLPVSVPGVALPWREVIWLEDESQRIGHINIPNTLWKTMSGSALLFLVIPFEKRLKHILLEYGKLDKEKVADAIIRIKKRLGGMESKNALQFLAENDMESCFRILLKYYDKSYNKALNNRERNPVITHLECSNVDACLNAKKILEIELVTK